MIIKKIFSVEELNRIIQKPDGNKRKTVLYNLCTASLLKSGEELLDKLMRNLLVFEENKEDIFVVFSTQEGIEDNIQLIRPDIYKRYKSVIEKFEMADFCVVIDNKDLDDVYEICDAFYGDWGIGAWNCKCMHKPVMIQNAKVD